MLKIKSLVKLYKKNRTTKHDIYALNDVNLSFEKKELVFIVGKSGSGKSTLLNIIGSLDKPTEGELYFLNQPYKFMSPKDIDVLRQNIAFIFQDFALIDEFNVYDNIKMARTDVNEEEIGEALRRVELEGFEKRKIKTLSAGQKQRVSIARAIAKKPKIILCDEPTGNLDFLTSQSILKCLKEISKDVLILLVSHNLDDAYTYGSRIIELGNGRVLQDIEINQQYNNQSYVVQDESLYLTTIKSIDSGELEKINNQIQSNKIKAIRPKTELYKEYKQGQNQQAFAFDAKMNKIRFKDLFKSSHKLLKKQFIRTVLFSLLASLMLSIFAISHKISKFDSNQYIADTMANNYGSDIIKSKPLEEKNSYTVPLVNGYQDSLKGTLGDDYFEIYPINVKISDQNYIVDQGMWPSMSSSLYSTKHKEIYPNSLLGTIKMSQEAFSKNINNNEGFQIIEEASEYKPYGLYITDVVADLFKAKGVSYLGYQTTKATNSKNQVNVSYCNGVIKTDFYSKFPNASDYLFKKLTRDDYNDLCKDKTVISMLQYLENTMLYCYTFDDNFLDAFLNSDLQRFYFPSFYCEMEGLNSYVTQIEPALDDLLQEHKYTRGTSSVVDQTSTDEFNHKVKVGYTYLNNKFDLDLSQEAWQLIVENYSNKLTFVFNDHQVTNMPVTRITYEIEEVLKDGTFATSNKYDVWKEIHTLTSTQPIGIVSWDKTFVSENINSFASLNLVSVSESNYIASRIAEMITIYSDLFDIILLVALATIVVSVMYLSYDAARRQAHNIGVLKSLGVRNKEIYGIFAIHEIEFIVISMILVFVCEYYFVNLANDVLILAMKKLYSGSVPEVSLFNFTGGVFAVSIVIVTASSFISYLLSLLKIKSYEPINILKSKY